MRVGMMMRYVAGGALVTDREAAGINNMDQTSAIDGAADHGYMYIKSVLKRFSYPLPCQGTRALIRCWGWCLAVLMLAVATGAAAQESRLDTIMKRGKLIVGTYSTSPPLAYADKDGKLTGFEVDLVRSIAKNLFGDPEKIEFVVFTSEGRFPAVLSGKIDFGIASTTISPERAMRVAFTHPYMDSGAAVLVRKDAGLKTIADLDNAKFTTAGLTTPLNTEWHKRYYPKSQFLQFEAPSSLFLALKTGRVQAIAIDTPIADYYALQNPELTVLGFLTDLTNNALFMKPGDFQLWLALDTIVREYRYGSRYAEYRELFHKWFGKDPPPQRFYSNPSPAK